MSHPGFSSHPPRSIPWIVVSRLVGLAIYFIIIVILSGIQTDNLTLISIISFLTEPVTIALVVTFSILFLVGEVFLALGLPLNLPGPFFNALGSVFLVSFLLQLLYLVDRIGSIMVFSVLKPLEPLFFFLVFLIVLIVQYVHLFSGDKEWRERPPPVTEKQATGQESYPPTHRDVSWEEVESEFRNMLYDFFHSIRDGLKRKE
ncbi:MAG: hypothetical protein LUO93_08065 [Methanomicrobiales archaeon]|nr:hypothetical protein [Methanomicrobiales archaeon]